jgi:hypothetical protein
MPPDPSLPDALLAPANAFSYDFDESSASGKKEPASSGGVLVHGAGVSKTRKTLSIVEPPSLPTQSSSDLNGTSVHTPLPLVGPPLGSH